MSTREELIAVMAEAWRESEAGTTTRAMVSVLDAALSSGLCVLVSDMAPVPNPVVLVDGSWLPKRAKDRTLVRLPVLIAEEAQQ